MVSANKSQSRQDLSCATSSVSQGTNQLYKTGNSLCTRPRYPNSSGPTTIGTIVASLGSTSVSRTSGFSSWGGTSDFSFSPAATDYSSFSAIYETVYLLFQLFTRLHICSSSFVNYAVTHPPSKRSWDEGSYIAGEQHR